MGTALLPRWSLSPLLQPLSALPLRCCHPDNGAGSRSFTTALKTPWVSRSARDLTEEFDTPLQRPARYGSQISTKRSAKNWTNGAPPTTAPTRQNGSAADVGGATARPS